MGFLAGLGVASSIAGGIIGGKDARDAERKNTALMREGQGLFGDARGALDDAEFGALADIDAANEILAGIEPDILEGLDDQLRVRVAQQMMRQQQAQAQMQQRAASMGLDSTTVGAGLQRSQAYGQAQDMGQLAAGFASQRANAMMQARTAHAQGLMNRASTVGQFGAQRAGMFAQEAGFLSGYQFQAPNTGAALGSIGGMLANAGFSDGMFGQSLGDAYSSALSALSGLPGGPTGGGYGLTKSELGGLGSVF